MNESEIKAEIIRTLRQAGALPVVVWQGPLSRKGISDLLVCLDGKFVAVEVKRPGGRATPEQLVFLRDVVRAGGIGIVAESVSDVVERLELQGRLLPLFQ